MYGHVEVLVLVPVLVSFLVAVLVWVLVPVPGRLFDPGRF